MFYHIEIKLERPPPQIDKDLYHLSASKPSSLSLIFISVYLRVTLQHQLLNLSLPTSAPGKWLFPGSSWPGHFSIPFLRLRAPQMPVLIHPHFTNSSISCEVSCEAGFFSSASDVTLNLLPRLYSYHGPKSHGTSVTACLKWSFNLSSAKLLK